MIMGWMADEYSQIVGQSSPAVITGKPIALGGPLGRNDARPHAAASTSFATSRTIWASLPVLRVAIQGFGNAGQFMAKLMAGARPQDRRRVGFRRGGLLRGWP